MFLIMGSAYIIHRRTQNPVLIIKAPTLLEFRTCPVQGCRVFIGWSLPTDGMRHVGMGTVWGLGFRVGLGLLGFRVLGLGFRVYGV